MASTILNANELASYSKLVPVFSGVKEELSIFIANLELLNDTIELEKLPSFFNFIFKTKLTAGVQNRVKQGTNDYWAIDICGKEHV